MGQTVGDALLNAAGMIQQARMNRKKMQSEDLDNLTKLAEINNMGYQVQSQGGRMGLTPSLGNALPKGFVRVAGKVMQDPSYVTPKEQADIDYKKSMTGFFGGGASAGNTSFDSDGNPVVTPSPEDTFKRLSQEDQATIKGLQDYTISPDSISNRGNKRIQYVSLAKSLDPTYDQTQFQARSKLRQDYTSGKTSQNVKSFNTAIQHLSELNQAIQNVPSSRFGPLEAAQRYGFQKFQSGSPQDLAMKNEDTALTAVSGELANVFKQSGGTDPEISKWFNAYDPNSSRETKRAFIQEGIKLLQGRIGALSSDYERGMGRAPEKALVYPETQKAIDQMLGGNKQQGGVLHVDAKGNKAIVYPDGSYKEVQ